MLSKQESLKVLKQFFQEETSRGNGRGTSFIKNQFTDERFSKA